MSRFWRLSAMLVLAGAAMSAAAEQIIVQTTQCYGETGVSSFQERDLYKIQEGDCEHPQRPGERLYQILLKSSSNVSQYNVLWVSRDVADDVMAQLSDNRQYRRQRFQPYGSLDLTVRQQQLPPPQLDAGSVPSAQTGAVTAQAGAAATVPPRIEILDPVLPATEDTYHAEHSVNEWLIVGRVEAESGLLSLSLNGRPVQATAAGAFRATLTPQGERTRAELLAVDNTGVRTVRTLYLVAPQ